MFPLLNYNTVHMFYSSAFINFSYATFEGLVIHSYLSDVAL